MSYNFYSVDRSRSQNRDLEPWLRRRGSFFMPSGVESCLFKSEAKDAGSRKHGWG